MLVQLLPPLPSRSAVAIISVLVFGWFSSSVGAAEGQIRPDLAPQADLKTRYHNVRGAVSSSARVAVSRAISRQIGSEFMLEVRRNSHTESRFIQSVEVQPRQYHSSEGARDRRTMLRIGAGLGAGYLLFLGGWIWATRVRNRRPRH